LALASGDFAAFADPHRPLEAHDVDLAIALPPRPRCAPDRLDHRVLEVIGHHDVHAHLVDRAEDVLVSHRAGFVTATSPEAVDVSEASARQALHVVQRLHNLLRHERLHECHNHLHATSSASRSDGSRSKRTYSNLVVGMYMHGVITRNAAKIVDALKPGGVLVVEGFHRDLNRVGVQGGPMGYCIVRFLAVKDAGAGDAR
jgi:hypothetical protein